MKDEILRRVSMQEVLDKYGIETRNAMFKCPFHGEDRHPSAKAYEKSFYCFACNKSDTLIGFTMDLFNLSFKEAMQKINLDFNLGLDSNTSIDYEKLNQIKYEQNEKKKIKQNLINKYCELCDLKFEYNRIIEYFKMKINIKNWNDLTHAISYFETQIFQLDCELDLINEKLSTRT